MTSFVIVTPVRNAETLIEGTASSILRQTILDNEQHHLHYIVVDGASTDHTLDVLNTLKSRCNSNSRIAFDIISEADEGMYDAIRKGFANARMGNDTVCAYLNAGDLYSPYALEVVAGIMDQEDVNWLTGLRSFYDRDGHLYKSDLPFTYKSSLIRACQYGKGLLPYIQQESTFWSGALLQTIDWSFLSSLRYAGDAYLWFNFSNVTDLNIVSCWLGGFRSHDGQLSQRHQKEYELEVASFRERLSVKSLPSLAVSLLMNSVPCRFRRFAMPNLFWPASTDRRFARRSELAQTKQLLP